MGFHIERRGYTTVKSLAGAVVDDLIANGFTKVFPTTTFNPATDLSVTLQASATVDPLAATQPWNIKMRWTDVAANDGYLDIIAGTPTQLPSNGSHTEFDVWALDSGTTLETGTTDTRRSTVAVPGGYKATRKSEILGLLGSKLYRSIDATGEPPTTGNQNSFTKLMSFPLNQISLDKPSRTFLDRSLRQSTELTAWPMSYSLSITPRGVVLFVWEQNADDSGNKNSWFVIQRPVDHSTGVTYTTGKAPVHCLYGLMTAAFQNKPWLDANYRFMDTGSSQTSLYIPMPPAQDIRRFVVRESDITVPYPGPKYVKDAFGSDYDYAEGGFNFGVSATEHTVDYNAVMNNKQQVAITENNKYVITFPNGFNTSRYAYTHELDMIAYTSADVISAGTEVSITVYGEPSPRVYRAMPANGPNNTGMRMLVLVSGGGV